MLRLSVPLSCNTSPLPDSPETVPPIVYVVVLHVTLTLVTFALAVPLPFATLHVCAGLFGWVRTVTLYVVPAASAAVNVKLPFELTARSLPPLSCRTSPDPDRPETVPPIV